MKHNAPKFYRFMAIGLALTSVLLFTAAASVVFTREKALSECDNLWSSAQIGDNPTVEQMLKNGVNPNCQCGEPMRRAKQFDHHDTVELLKQYGASETACK